MGHSTDAVDALIKELGLRPKEVSPDATSQHLVTYDPSWKSISASLRVSPEGVLSIYLKLPASKLWDIVMGISYVLAAHAQALNLDKIARIGVLHKFLRQEHDASMAPSIFLRIPVKEVEVDILCLAEVSKHDTVGAIGTFLGALRAGLRTDPTVDWITRCGGPAYIVSDSGNSTPQSGDEESSGLSK